MALFTNRFTGATGAGTEFKIERNDGISKYSFLLISGTATILGTKTINGIAPTPISLEVGRAFNGSSINQQAEVTLQVDDGAVVDVAAENE